MSASGSNGTSPRFAPTSALRAMRSLYFRIGRLSGVVLARLELLLFFESVLTAHQMTEGLARIGIRPTHGSRRMSLSFHLTVSLVPTRLLIESAELDSVPAFWEDAGTFFI